MIESRLFKNIICIILCAVSALFYVHQEVEIIKTGLCINENRREVSFLLDQYRSLVYNLSRLESPKRVEDTLSESEIMLCMPKIENIRHFDRISKTYAEGSQSKKGKESLLARIFDRFSTKAEAKVITNSYKP
ncbi:MAG: hypothetical protein HQ549_05950 [Candidatus Omnitrophica bacterium]|nr:hypothetical protein [Candidatus Omnitrophota bacterium]